MHELVTFHAPRAFRFQFYEVVAAIDGPKLRKGMVAAFRGVQGITFAMREHQPLTKYTHALHLVKGVTIPEPGASILKTEQSTPPDGPKGEFLGIQALRCFAALLVVITHATYVWVDHASGVSRPAPWDNGTVGVDIFFVISGFVMMTSSRRLHGQKHPARVFLWRRLVRIAPLYWLLTSVKLLLVEARPTLALHSLPSHWNVVASYLFLPSYGATGEVRPVLPVGWTLNFEMFFYVLFAIALAMRIRVLYILFPVMGLLGVGAFYRTPDAPAFATFADPIVLDFVAGVLIALFLEQIQAIPIKFAGTAAAVAAIQIMLFSPHASISLMHVLAYGGGATVIVGATVICEPHLARALPGWVLFLGDASYSTYLMQSFGLAAVAEVLVRVDLFRGALPAGVVECVCILAGVSSSILLALPVYQYIERPLTRHLKRINLRA